MRPEPSIQKGHFVLAIDIPDEAYEVLQRKSALPVIRMGVEVDYERLSATQRLRVAEYYLYLYQSARLVVTTRLHATLPCLALGTPVLNLELPGFDATRFVGLRELAHHMTVEEFVTSDYNVNRPLENPTDYLSLAHDLEDRCRDFTGFDRPSGFLHGRRIEDLLADPDLIQSIAGGLWKP